MTPPTPGQDLAAAVERVTACLNRNPEWTGFQPGRDLVLILAALSAPGPLVTEDGVFKVLTDYGQHVRDHDALGLDPVADTYVQRVLALLQGRKG